MWRARGEPRIGRGPGCGKIGRSEQRSAVEPRASHAVLETPSTRGGLHPGSLSLIVSSVYYRVNELFHLTTAQVARRFRSSRLRFDLVTGSSSGRGGFALRPPCRAADDAVRPPRCGSRSRVDPRCYHLNCKGLVSRQVHSVAALPGPLRLPGKAPCRRWGRRGRAQGVNDDGPADRRLVDLSARTSGPAGGGGLLLSFDKRGRRLLERAIAVPDLAEELNLVIREAEPGARSPRGRPGRFLAVTDAKSLFRTFPIASARD